MPLPIDKSEKRLNAQECKYLFYGKPKVGKTTTAAKLGEAQDDGNRSLFFAAEPGHNFVEVYQWHKIVNGEERAPENWMDFVKCCSELYEQENLVYKMLVVDTVDILWKWCDAYICQMNNISHLSEMGFGKAYAAVSNEFSRVINKLCNRGVGIIFISHRKEYEIKVGARSETAYTHTLPSGATKFVDGFVDFIWFFNQDVDGNRYIQTQHENNVNAGSRGDMDKPPLPTKLEMDAKVIVESIAKL